MDLWQRKAELGEAIKEFLLRYNWEWFCTLNLQRGADCAKAESMLKAWRVKMGIRDHILFAYMGVFNTIPQPHLHLLALSKQNRFGQTLPDLNYRVWEHAWSELTKCQAVIEPIYDPINVTNYITEKNLPWNKSELITPYQKRILQRAMVN
jgi:hypothetical protein